MPMNGESRIYNGTVQRWMDVRGWYKPDSLTWQEKHWLNSTRAEDDAAEKKKIEDLQKSRMEGRNKNKKDFLRDYTIEYTEDQIQENHDKVVDNNRARDIYNAAEMGKATELLTLVEPWFAHPVLNKYGGLEKRWTPLMIASLNDEIECVKVLLAQPGIEINKGDRQTNQTALYLASFYGHDEIVKVLCSMPGIDVTKAHKNGSTPSSIACRECDSHDPYDPTGKLWKIKTILSSTEEAERILNKEKAEAEARLQADDPTYNRYKKKYTDKEIKKNKKKIAPKGTGEAICEAAEKGKEAELFNLVEPWFAHPVLNDYSGNGGTWTPLIGASFNGRIECVRVLVAQPGIDLNKGDRDYQSTALLWASCWGHVDIVELLCSLPGIDCKKASTSGDTPYSIVCHQYKGTDKATRRKRILNAIKEAIENSQPIVDDSSAPAGPTEEWKEKFSNKHKQNYWKNQKTGEVVWKDPNTTLSESSPVFAKERPPKKEKATPPEGKTRLPFVLKDIVSPWERPTGGGSSNKTEKQSSKINNNRKTMKSTKKQTKKSKSYKRRTIKKH
jgi:ankyrin repeat protein